MNLLLLMIFEFLHEERVINSRQPAVLAQLKGAFLTAGEHGENKQRLERDGASYCSANIEPSRNAWISPSIHPLG